MLLSGFSRGRYELCNPREFFNIVEDAINFIQYLYHDNDIEWINETDKALSQPQIGNILNLPKER